MSMPTYDRPGPTPGPPRPISFRLQFTEDEHRRAKLLAAHERRFLCRILRECIEERYRALGLDDDGRRRRARRKAK